MFEYPNKRICLGDESFMLHGLSRDDPYFKGLIDNYEPDFAFLCRHLIDDNSHCLDLGANIGVKSLIMARQARQGRVLAVEASPNVAKVLRLNVKANRADNIEVAQTAIGDHEGEVVFHENTCWGSVRRDSSESATIPLGENETIVPLTTLPALAERAGFQTVDFIKMDIEGSEFAVLRNSLPWLKQHRPLLVFEFNSLILFSLDISPLSSLRWMLDNFRSVYAINKGHMGANIIFRLDRENLRGILIHNMARDGFVTDFLVTDNEAHDPALSRLLALPYDPVSGTTGAPARNANQTPDSFSAEALSQTLRGRKVAIKGAGVMAKRLLRSLDRDIEVKCLLTRGPNGHRILGVEVIPDQDLDRYDVDTIVISSAQHRWEMLEDLKKLHKPYNVMDLFATWKDTAAVLDTM